MNSLEAIEKLRIRPEQEAQQCIEIFRSFCQWYQSQYNFEQIEFTFWNACIYLIEKQKCRIDKKFSEALLELKSTEIDFISDKLEQGYSSYEQLEQALLEKGYGLDDVSVRIDSMRQDYEQQKHDALERVVHKKEIRTIKMEELRSEVEQLKEGQILCVLNLDAHGVVQNANIVSMGTVNQTVSSPREIFKSAILSNAHSIILMHNHPSGSVKPFSDTKIAAEEKNVKEETTEYIIPKKEKIKAERKMIMSEMQEGIQMAMMTGQAMAFVVDKGVTLTRQILEALAKINKNECIVYNTENKE